MLFGSDWRKDAAIKRVCKSTSMFSTPVLFLIFNRPDTTRIVFEQIRKRKPEKLFIAADGPRTKHPPDKLLCARCIEIVSAVDWECEVKTLIRTQNMGCGAAPASAITWFFQQVTEGIILEDDCVPNDSFFDYAASLLQFYRENPEIMMICGTSYQPHPLNDDSFYFSRYPHVWGWATWRRAWERYNFDLSGESEAERAAVISKTFPNAREQKLWRDNMRMIINGLDAWDYQLMYWMWKNDAMCIVPWRNMISNIGFGKHATHTSDSGSAQSAMPQYDIKEIHFPQTIALNPDADRYERSHIFIDPAGVYLKKRLAAAFRRLKRIFGL